MDQRSRKSPAGETSDTTLRRENLQALPPSQRTLMTLVLRKLLASSSFAIAGVLTSISNRLKAQLKADEPKLSLEDELDEDYE